MTNTMTLKKGKENLPQDKHILRGTVCGTLFLSLFILFILASDRTRLSIRGGVWQKVILKPWVERKLQKLLGESEILKMAETIGRMWNTVLKIPENLGTRKNIRTAESFGTRATFGGGWANWGQEEDIGVDPPPFCATTDSGFPFWKSMNARILLRVWNPRTQRSNKGFSDAKN